MLVDVKSNNVKEFKIIDFKGNLFIKEKSYF